MIAHKLFSSKNTLRIASRKIGKEFLSASSTTTSLIPFTMKIERLFLSSTLASLHNKSQTQVDSRQIIMSQIEDYFSDKSIKYNLDITEFTDPEYPDWNEKKITIKVDTNIKKLYEEIKPDLLKHLQDNVDNKYFENILLKFETT